MKRRHFVAMTGTASVALYSSIKDYESRKLAPGPIGNSAVCVLKAQSYQEDLAGKILAGIQMCGLDVKGKRVLLKPNLVEFDPGTVINTDPAVVRAALRVFRALGAAEVRIGEGPGHRRDSYGIADQAAYFREITQFDRLFVDLNRDDVSPVHGFATEPVMYFPHAALGADLIVSLPKMKTHHWAVATLAMKNLFGLVPGSVYGWPKNKLHFIGIPESIVALARTFPNTFAIVDGIVGMEGNGPIQGTPKHAGVLVMGRDPVAVDATCCRIMGIDPLKVEYLRMAARLGHLEPDRIEQRAETVSSARSDFQLIPDFEYCRLA
jgi:uncharacterized protein (DUF362 family)